MPESEEDVIGILPDLIFIYGTLHPNRAPASIAATARLLKPFGKATIQARLYHLGEYPGVIFTDNPADAVPGELFLLPDGPEAAGVLARLDDYEDFRPTDPANSLFLRQRNLATLEDGTMFECWVYTYNLPLPQQLRDG